MKQRFSVSPTLAPAVASISTSFYWLALARAYPFGSDYKEEAAARVSAQLSCQYWKVGHSFVYAKTESDACENQIVIFVRKPHSSQNCNVICGGIPGGMNVTALVELLLPLLARVLQSHHHHQQSMGLASSQPELEGEAPGQDYGEGHTQ